MSKSSEKKPAAEPAATVIPSGQVLTKEFDFKLSMRELAERAQKMAALSGEAADEERALAAISAQKRLKIKEVYEELDKIAAAVRSGKEARMCEAIMSKDHAVGLVQFWFKDEDSGNYALIEERAMTEEERQMDIADVSSIPHPEAAARRKGKKAKPAAPPTEDEDIADVRAAETGRRTKRSAVDGVYA